MAQLNVARFGLFVQIVTTILCKVARSQDENSNINENPKTTKLAVGADFRRQAQNDEYNFNIPARLIIGESGKEGESENYDDSSDESRPQLETIHSKYLLRNKETPCVCPFKQFCVCPFPKSKKKKDKKTSRKDKQSKSTTNTKNSKKPKDEKSMTPTFMEISSSTIESKLEPDIEITSRSPENFEITLEPSKQIVSKEQADNSDTEAKPVILEKPEFSNEEDPYVPKAPPAMFAVSEPPHEVATKEESQDNHPPKHSSTIAIPPAPYLTEESSSEEDWPPPKSKVKPPKGYYHPKYQPQPVDYEVPYPYHQPYPYYVPPNNSYGPNKHTNKRPKKPAPAHKYQTPQYQPYPYAQESPQSYWHNLKKPKASFGNYHVTKRPPYSRYS